MIITQKKPIDELLAMLTGVRKVALVGCGNCASACQTGGEKEMQELKAILEEQGIEVVAAVLPEECCHKMLVKRELKVLRGLGVDAIVGMACGDGVQTVADNVDIHMVKADLHGSSETCGAKIQRGEKAVFNFLFIVSDVMEFLPLPLAKGRTVKPSFIFSFIVHQVQPPSIY